MHRFVAIAPLASLLASLLAVAGCASVTRLPDEDRIQLTRQLEGKPRYLRSSCYVLPFFSDTTRRLVSAAPPDSIELLVDPSGNPILPGEPEGMLPLGTKVIIEKIEHPTSLVVTRRPLYSPRTVPWVYLSVADQPKGRPLVLVLRQGLKTREDFMAAVDQILSESDPVPTLADYTAEVRAAIQEKRLVSGMDSHAVSLAWGRPERIRQEWVDGVRTQTWTWPLGKREATFRDDKLSAATPPLR